MLNWCYVVIRRLQAVSGSQNLHHHGERMTTTKMWTSHRRLHFHLGVALVLGLAFSRAMWTK